MRIVFMGSPEISQIALKELLRAGHKVVGVFTREDKPVGRKQIVSATAVKIRAVQNGLKVFQPTTLRDADVVATLQKLHPEIIVVVAYGLLLPPEVLAIPRYGCINLHISLLPKYRGAAPVQWAIINGEKETGVSIMQMDEGLDTGPVLAQEKIEIRPWSTAEDILDEAGDLGAQLLVKTLQQIAAGTAKAVPQKGKASYAPRLQKEDAAVDFRRDDAQRIHNVVRGCNPWPMAWAEMRGKRLQLVVTNIVPREGGEAGEVLSLKPLTVACREGAVSLERVIPEGSCLMTGTEWAAGKRLKAGYNMYFEFVPRTSLED